MRMNHEVNEMGVGGIGGKGWMIATDKLIEKFGVAAFDRQNVQNWAAASPEFEEYLRLRRVEMQVSL